MQKYILIVRDTISTPHRHTDKALERLNCIYMSPEFLWDGSFDSADAILNQFSTQFNHMLHWTATFVRI